MLGPSQLPYRPCVGIALFNQNGEIFVGKRARVSGSHAWQMPQGGIDTGEEPYDAAIRELAEETGVRSVEKLGQIDEWLCYDLPEQKQGKAFKGRYRGQAQRWFAFKFVGEQTEIELDAHDKPEFSEWKWVTLAETPSLVVPFKKQVYLAVVTAFAPLAKRAARPK